MTDFDFAAERAMLRFHPHEEADICRAFASMKRMGSCLPPVCELPLQTDFPLPLRSDLPTSSLPVEALLQNAPFSFGDLLSTPGAAPFEEAEA